MEKTGIDDYFEYTSYNYFKIDYDKFLRKNLPIYKDEDNRGVIRLQKSNFEINHTDGKVLSNFKALMKKQNAHQEWDSIEVKDLFTLFKIFTLIGNKNESISFNLRIRITYREGSIRLNRTIELSFKQ